MRGVFNWPLSLLVGVVWLGVYDVVSCPLKVVFPYFPFFCSCSHLYLALNSYVAYCMTGGGHSEMSKEKDLK